MQVVTQPFLHDVVTCVRAPTAVLSGNDGQMRPGQAHGLLHADRRFLSELVVTVDGREPTPIGVRLVDGSRCEFVAIVVGAGDPIADPTVRVERTRTALPTGMREHIVVVNASRTTITVDLAVRAAADMASIDDVKHGRPCTALTAEPGPTTRWCAGPYRTELCATDDAPVANVAGSANGVALTWRLAIAPGGHADVTLHVDVNDADAARHFAAVAPPAWTETLSVESNHPHLAPLVRRSIADLGALLLGDPAAATESSTTVDAFAAAGSPWFLTLFGRDSLWTARFALPLGTDLAAGTLRTLARRQARDVDRHTGAEPGKILHEVRTSPVTVGDGGLPPLYYGTVDATPLWISLLHDAWRWGLHDDDVVKLLDPLEAALGWVLGHGDDGRDMFLSYRDADGTGLTNQGWKDSGDSIQDAAGSIAKPPITLCEVQGYAYRAALDAASVLDAFDRPGGERARHFAAELAARFRRRFWVERDGASFPAVALDGEGRQVDSLTSNIGHLLSTGLLDAGEEHVVAGLLADRRLFSDYGLRTLDADHPHFNPLGYHSGSVWPHDTTIAVDGLVRAGHAPTAAALVEGLLDAAAHFDFRLPELFGGWASSDGPLPYPAACRPQAWAAGCALVVVGAALGLSADVPGGSLTVRSDEAFAALYPLRVEGLRIAGHRLDIAIDADGRADVTTAAALTVRAT